MDIDGNIRQVEHDLLFLFSIGNEAQISNSNPCLKFLNTIKSRLICQKLLKYSTELKQVIIELSAMRKLNQTDTLLCSRKHVRIKIVHALGLCYKLENDFIIEIISKI